MPTITQTLYIRAKRWAMGNRWGQVVLLLFAPYFVTPNDFVVMTDEKSRTFVRLAKFTTSFSASAFAGFLASKLAVKAIVSEIPNIDGASGAEYVAKLSNLSFCVSVYVTVVALAFIHLSSFLEPLYHKAIRSISKRYKDEFGHLDSRYSLLMASSNVVWFSLLSGALCLVWIAIKRIPTQQEIEILASNYKYAIISCAIIYFLLDLKREQIKSETNKQLFVTRRARWIHITVSFVLFGVFPGLSWFAYMRWIAY